MTGQIEDGFFLVDYAFAKISQDSKRTVRLKHSVCSAPLFYRSNHLHWHEPNTVKAKVISNMTCRYFCVALAVLSLALRSTANVFQELECKAFDLSFVITARNDRHGGDFLQRLRNTVDNLSRFAWRDHGIRTEILVISYNDPDGTDPLHVALGFQNGHWHDDNALIRFIFVPSLYHAMTENPLNLSMHQYRAKNIGMRRSGYDVRFTLHTYQDKKI